MWWPAMYLSHAAVMVRGMPPFHPATLPGLAALYDASDLATLKVERTGASASTPASVDGVVGTVLDLSGNGNHVVAVSDAARPILRSSDGSYWLKFDGVDDTLENASSFVLNLTTNTVFVVASEESEVNNSGVLSVKPSSGDDWRSSDGMAFETGGSTMLFSVRCGDMGSPYLVALNGSGAMPLAIYENVKDASTGSLYVNGVSVASDNSWLGVAENSAGGLVLGSRWTGGALSATQKLNGRIYAIAAFNRVLSDVERTQVRQWCAQKAGVAL